MRFTPAVPNPVMTHGQARVAKDYHPAPGEKPETVKREDTRKSAISNLKSPIAKVPDATLAFLLGQARCEMPVAAARKAFLKWLATQPACADWRISFRTFALANAEVARPALRGEAARSASSPTPDDGQGDDSDDPTSCENIPVCPPPSALERALESPVAHVTREIAEAFGMTNLPNVRIVDPPHRWLARLRNRQPQPA